VSDERIDPNVIGITADAVADCLEGDLRERSCAVIAEAAIRAADEARGLKEERSVMADYMCSERYVLAEGEKPAGPIEVRYVSDWRPVDRPS
jgi:hypothetical protein